MFYRQVIPVTDLFVCHGDNWYLHPHLRLCNQAQKELVGVEIAIYRFLIYFRNISDEKCS